MGSFSERTLKKTRPVLSNVTCNASLSGSSFVETELGVFISTGSSGLNLVAMMKNVRIRKATSTNGVISTAVLFLGILTLGMFKII
jgi:hypothetical protein